MSGRRNPKAIKAMELLKDKRMTTKQVAMRPGISERHARRLRNLMEGEKNAS